ncbi:equilibrative Nucleoside Transporter (ENT) family [Thraustotheca clavata]|uniref:Equilibrative Nucleoside Transporter (ENT) family n=1 Tax=Thraustotheca clavata TaxID=74557 RepID=A0A1V9Y837_9STRA|nr:equilibrative Nucleoside Transporter (ENT) family [Thraustotheca clavata]
MPSPTRLKLEIPPHEEEINKSNEDESFSTPGYAMAYFTFFTFGGTAVASWQAIILSIDTFITMYPDGMVGFVFPVVNMSALLVITLFMLIAGRQLPLDQRMRSGFSSMLVACVCLPLLQWTSYSTTVRYTGTLILLIIASMAAALIQSSACGLGAVFGPSFLQAIDAGKGTGAMLLVLARIFTKWGVEGEANEIMALSLFFSIAVLIVLVSFFLYIILDQNVYAKSKLETYLRIQYSTPLALPLPSPVRSPMKSPAFFSPANESTPMLKDNITIDMDKESSDSESIGEPAPSVLSVFRSSWKPVSMAFFTFCICLSCFPGLTSSVASTSSWFPILMVGAYTIGDLIGKTLPLHYMLLSVETIHYPVLIQILFVPIFMYDILHPYLLPDLATYSIVCALGLVTGYVGTSSMMLAPTTCREVEQELVGITGSLAIIIGLFTGSYLGLFFNMIVQMLQ